MTPYQFWMSSAEKLRVSCQTWSERALEGLSSKSLFLSLVVWEWKQLMNTLPTAFQVHCIRLSSTVPLGRRGCKRRVPASGSFEKTLAPPCVSSDTKLLASTRFRIDKTDVQK